MSKEIKHLFRKMLNLYRINNHCLVKEWKEYGALERFTYHEHENQRYEVKEELEIKASKNELHELNIIQQKMMSRFNALC